MEEAYNDLYKTVWITRGARFIASKRYKNLQRLSSFGISILSFYIISLGIYSFSNLNEESANWLNILSLCSSVFILILSVHEGSKQFDLKAHLFHVCGKDLSEIYNKIKNDIKLKRFDQKDFNELLSNYESIVKTYDENHADVDNKIFRAKNWDSLYKFSYDPNSHPIFSGAEKFFLPLKFSLKRLWYTTTIYGLYILIIFVPPFIFLLWIFKL